MTRPTSQAKWLRVPLGTVADVVSGYAFPSTDFGEQGVPILKIKNIRTGFVELSDVDHVDEKYLTLPDRFHVRPGDVLISLTGSHISQPNSVVGRVAKHGKDLPHCLLNQRGGKVVVKDPTTCDLSFLFHALSDRDTIRAIALKAHGAANQANVSPSQVESIEVPMPPLWAQRSIASFLSAYDDLIENNSGRMVLLEEMARRIFEEWFVRFHAPGYESVPLADSAIGPLPADWYVEPLGKRITLESGSRPKGGIKALEDGVPSIGAENIKGLGRYDYSKERLVSRDFFEAMHRGKIKSGDVMLYKDGAHIGRKALFRDGYPYSECAINEHVFALRPTPPYSPAFLYFWLDRPENTDRIRRLNGNAAQPGINQAGVNGLPLLRPPEALILHFTELAEPLLALLFNLAKTNRNLNVQRDLVLPKLISGEIQVSSAERVMEAAE